MNAGQAALAAEHAIVYGYGVVGGQLSGALQRLAAESLRVHQQRRDDLLTQLIHAHVDPPSADPAYSTPFPVTATGSARRFAVLLETRGAGAAWDLLAASAIDSDGRTLAVRWLADAADRISRWGGAVPPLPGQPV